MDKTTTTTSTIKNEGVGVGDCGGSPDSNEATKSKTTSSAVTCNGKVATVGDNASIVQATYRQLLDEDVDWQTRNNTRNKMGKQNGGTEATEVDDDAQERMLNDNVVKPAIVPTKDATEVHFKSENGDTKINIETVKQCMSGMSKQELMKYANDPFWIKLRWFFFIAFWLLWVAMLAGAIAIVVMAPKCTPPAPKKWWEESPIVRLSPADTPAKNLRGLESLLDTLLEQGVKAISLYSILKETSPGHIEDFRDINPKVGTIQDFMNFVNAAKERKQNVILEVDPNHTSNQHPWFQNSIKKDGKYTDYYVWADGRTNKESKILLEPNNWISVNDSSAWKFNQDRGQYYLHQFSSTQPDLNYNNTAVINEFSDILKFWIKSGVKGFVLSNTRYLVENSTLANDTRSADYPADQGLYSSLLHTNTKDFAQNEIVLEQWRSAIINETKDNNILFTLSDGIRDDWQSISNKPKKLIDIPKNMHFMSKFEKTITASNVHESIKELLTFSEWPAIDFSTMSADLKKNMNDLSTNFMLMTMLLPATPILKINDTIEAKKAFATLAEARSNDAFQHGDIFTKVLANGTVFAYTRIKSGSPGYLVALNTDSKNTTIDVTDLPHVSEEVSIFTYSPNYKENVENKKLYAKNIPLSSESLLVVTFVPK